MYKERTDSTVNSFLNIAPLVMLVVVILSVDNTFSHSIRDYSKPEFFSYHVPEDTVFVFPNITRIILLVAFITVALVFATMIVSYAVTTLKAAQTRRSLDVKAPKSLNIKTEETQKATNILTLVPYIIAALIMPSILLFNLYNTNRVDSHLVFAHVLILAGLLGVAGLLIFFAFKSGTGSTEGSFLMSIAFWLFFWRFEAIYSMVDSIIKTLTPVGLMMVMSLILLCISKIIRRLNIRLAKLGKVFSALALCLLAPFLFNLLPGINQEIEITRASAAASGEENPLFYIKSNFVIDDTLPTPDIYWIHVDGMLSLEAVERYWGVSQDQLREEFVLRGFVIYPDAKFNGALTRAATTALFSPAFYDSFLGERMNQAETLLQPHRTQFWNSGLTMAGLTYENDISPNFEFPIAFINRGYDVEIVRTGPEFVPRSIENLSRDNYIRNDSWITIMLGHIGDLPELLNKTTPLNIISAEERTNWMRAGVRDRDISKPRLVIDIHNVKTGDMRSEARAQALGARFSLDFSDSIIAENPDAIIVLQSDHGPVHSTVNQRNMLDQGYSIEQVLEQLHSVFSAVRIPEKYGGLNEPLAPLNISRELVNRFVGKNYELLP